MTNVAETIINKALQNAIRSANYFDFFKQEDPNTEMANIYWANTQEHDGKAEAYLDVYEMLTGKKVLNVTCEIEKEWLIYHPEVESALANL